MIRRQDDLASEVAAVPADQELVKAVRGGDLEAFSVLVKNNEVRIRSLCLSILGSPADADDAAQDAFVRAFEKLDLFRGDAQFSTWVFRIAYRVCLDRLRSRRARRTDSLESLMETAGSNGALAVESGSVNQAETRDLIGRALSLLSPDHRTILWMREGEGRRYDEIATLLNISVDAVKSKLYRAREALRHATRHIEASSSV